MTRVISYIYLLYCYVILCIYGGDFIVRSSIDTRLCNSKLTRVYNIDIDYSPGLIVNRGYCDSRFRYAFQIH